VTQRQESEQDTGTVEAVAVRSSHNEGEAGQRDIDGVDLKEKAAVTVQAAARGYLDRRRVTHIRFLLITIYSIS